MLRPESVAGHGAGSGAAVSRACPVQVAATHPVSPALSADGATPESGGSVSVGVPVSTTTGESPPPEGVSGTVSSVAGVSVVEDGSLSAVSPPSDTDGARRHAEASRTTVPTTPSRAAFMAVPP